MPASPKQINAFTFFKLPSAFWSGVRVKEISKNQCVTSIKLRWFNQNPFKSMFWASQGMAAELSTGALVMSCIKDSQAPISMLVAQNRASFFKKAIGRINFTCIDGEAILDAITKAVETKEGRTCWMKSVGRNEQGEEVSCFEFEWTVKLRSKS